MKPPSPRTAMLRRKKLADNGPFIVSIDLRGNNGQVFPMVRDDPQVQARFKSLRDIEALKKDHFMGVMPWIVTNIDTEDAICLP